MFAVAVLNPYIDLAAGFLPRLRPLAEGAMKYALETSKTAISSSSSSGLLLFGTSLLTSLLKNTFGVSQSVMALKRFMCQPRSLGLRL